MGILLDMIKKAQEGKQFKSLYQTNNTCEDRNCMRGSINIFKTREPDIYTISIDCSEIFPSKAKLYEYYHTLYKSFENHFNQVTTIKDIENHRRTYMGDEITLSISGDYYGIYEGLKFTGKMADARDWLCGTVQNIYNICID